MPKWCQCCWKFIMNCLTPHWCLRISSLNVFGPSMENTECINANQSRLLHFFVVIGRAAVLILFNITKLRSICFQCDHWFCQIAPNCKFGSVPYNKNALQKTIDWWVTFFKLKWILSIMFFKHILSRKWSAKYIMPHGDDAIFRRTFFDLEPNWKGDVLNWKSNAFNQGYFGCIWYKVTVYFETGVTFENVYYLANNKHQLSFQHFFCALSLLAQQSSNLWEHVHVWFKERG